MSSVVAQGCIDGREGESKQISTSYLRTDYGQAEDEACVIVDTIDDAGGMAKTALTQDVD